MRKRKLYQNMLCGIFIVLMFGSFLVNSETTQEGQCWGDLRETYTYILDNEFYNYNFADPLTETYEEITIWDVESLENEISFRTDMWEVFLGMVSCDNETCYDLYRAAWLYENETESFKVTYRYDNETQELGFVNPITLDLLGLNADVPVNPMELVKNLFMYYQGLGFTFLPVFHSNFSFETDFQIYELAYPDFEIEFKDTFRFQRKKFEGYYYKMSYTVEDERYPGLWYKEEISRYYSFNTQGVLYDFYNEIKHYTNESGDYKLQVKGILRYYLDSYDETLVVAHSWVYGIGAILITSTVIVYKRRK
ncbi:MAG: hypothetical protein GOP50_07375 [Candidatus Heimdallarchaeota archaeon]|nr:hypothetical protein [Candidatus Heimdallarchaeota archaeon]